MEEELLKVEKGFVDAIAKNDLEAIERFVTDDWIIINADGGIIDRERFLGVIKSDRSNPVRWQIFQFSIAMITGSSRTGLDFHRRTRCM